MSQTTTRTIQTTTEALQRTLEEFHGCAPGQPVGEPGHTWVLCTSENHPQALYHDSCEFVAGMSQALVAALPSQQTPQQTPEPAP